MSLNGVAKKTAEAWNQSMSVYLSRTLASDMKFR